MAPAPAAAIAVDSAGSSAERSQALQAAPLQITASDLLDPEPAHELSATEMERLMFGLVNKARQQHLPSWLGRDTLHWHPLAANVARQHSADMLRRDYVDHVSPDGLDAGKRLDRERVSYLACGENIGVIVGPASHGRQGIEQVQRTFMNQPNRLTNHRGNILNPLWTHVGIGACYAPQGKLYLTQIFLTTLVGTS